MQRSTEFGELAAALAKAQSQFKSVGKDKSAKIQSQKGAFSYAYADLATVIEATRPALTANGLAVMQPVRREDGQAVVTTILAHASGQFISEDMAWPVADADNRSIGSGVTYARRHSYLAMVGGAATDEDDDAEHARGGAHETAKPASRVESVKAKVAAANGHASPPMPKDAEARKMDLKARTQALGFKGADVARKIGEWIGRECDGATTITTDDWLKADAAISLAKTTKGTLEAAGLGGELL